MNGKKDKETGKVPVASVPVALALWLAAVCGAAAGEPLGLVLSGGGAKGAYEVGVWQVLEEEGLAGDVAAISGTSVGALNAALFATRPEAAEELWREHMGEVFKLNPERLGEDLQWALNRAGDAGEQYGKVKKARLAEEAERRGVDVGELPDEVKAGAEKEAKINGIFHLGLSMLMGGLSHYVEMTHSDSKKVGYLDASKLEKAIDTGLPPEWPEGAPAAYATALEKGTRKTTATWRLNGEPHGRRVAMVRASSAIPDGYTPVTIDGKTYVDGGWESKGGDNVPVEPILEHHPEIRTVVIVYLDDEEHLNRERRERNQSAAQKAGVRLVEIVPSEDIGGPFMGWWGVFDSRPETAKHLIALGREDARKVLSEERP